MSHSPVPVLISRSSHVRGRALLRTLALLLVLALVAGGVIGWQDYHAYGNAALPISGAGTTFEVARGTSYARIVAQLREQGLVAGDTRSSLYWRLLGRESKIAARLHAGEYALMPGLTPRELLRKMAAGEVVQHHFTIIDGWTFRQLRLALANSAGLLQTLPGLSDEDIARELGIADGKPEGWFLAETYSFVKGESDLDILKRSHEAMRKALDRLWPQRTSEVRLDSPYQALILASIVEKETAQPDERPLIAGVFLRRLKFNMRLQTDPTVIYGMGAGFDGNIRRRDLETDTPWNTYTRDGLPPTPIALPGIDALQAVMHPAPGDALYFVARGDGSHEFSPTLDAHNRAVQKYQLRRGQ